MKAFIMSHISSAMTLGVEICKVKWSFAAAKTR
jgi:hypothetical protein